MSVASVAATLDEIPKPVLIAGMVLCFIWFWPAGLAVLAYMIWSGRMGFWKSGRCGGWGHRQGWERDGREAVGGRWGAGGDAARAGWSARAAQAAPSSGNHAFDEYRAETLRRLEDEQQEFVDFLERLRMAKDKAEFDQFMAERRQRPAAGPGPAAPQPPAA